MLRMSHALVLLLVMLMLMPESDGWLFGRRTRNNYNHCHCGADLKKILAFLKGLGLGNTLGRRDVATILDVDEGDPHLAELMQKRDGMVAKEELYDAAKRAYTHLSTDVKKRNQCHCGNKVLQHFGRSLD